MELPFRQMRQQPNFIKFNFITHNLVVLRWGTMNILLHRGRILGAAGHLNLPAELP